MNRFRAHLPDHESTVAAGRILGEALFPGAVVGLTGELGAGKTTMVAGIAMGLGLEDGYHVSSPTYTLLQEYPCRDATLYHLDLYRITGVDDLDSTGYRDIAGSGGVLVVEWPERQPEVLPAQHLAVRLRYSGLGRDLEVEAGGPAYGPVLDHLANSPAVFH